MATSLRGEGTAPGYPYFVRITSGVSGHPQPPAPGRPQAGRGGRAAPLSAADAAELAGLLGVVGEPVRARLPRDAPCDANAVARSQPIHGRQAAVRLAGADGEP